PRSAPISPRRGAAARRSTSSRCRRSAAAAVVAAAAATRCRSRSETRCRSPSRIPSRIPALAAAPRPEISQGSLTDSLSLIPLHRDWLLKVLIVGLGIVLSIGVARADRPKVGDDKPLDKTQQAAWDRGVSTDQMQAAAAAFDEANAQLDASLPSK